MTGRSINSRLRIGIRVNIKQWIKAGSDKLTSPLHKIDSLVKSIIL